jgi:hypothetical protein
VPPKGLVIVTNITVPFADGAFGSDIRISNVLYTTVLGV